MSSIIFNIISNYVFLTESYAAEPIKLKYGDYVYRSAKKHAKVRGTKLYSELLATPKGNLENKTQSKTNIR